jgi:hypothetical protein
MYTPQVNSKQIPTQQVSVMSVSGVNISNVRIKLQTIYFKLLSCVLMVLFSETS